MLEARSVEAECTKKVHEHSSTEATQQAAIKIKKLSKRR